MRRAPHLALLALAGCNAVFGIEKTDPRPDAPPPDAKWDAVRVSVVLATPQPPPGSLEPYAVAAVPFPGTVEYGTIDGPLQPATRGMNGEVFYPPSFDDARWRLVITMPDGVPHEVQWTPPRDAHVALPIVGRMDRTAPPPNSGYLLDTTRTTVDARVFTTGIWNDRDIGSNTDPVETFLSGEPALSGSPGVPDAGRGDKAFIADRKRGIPTDCIITEATAMFDPPPLQQDVLTLVSGITFPVGTLLSAQFSVSPPFALLDDRLMGALGSHFSPETVNAVLVGSAPSALVPAFTSEQNDFAAPVMFPFGQCPLSTAQFSYKAPNELASLPRVAFGYVSNGRRITNGPVMSSFVAAATIESSPGSNEFPLIFNAPLPLDAMLGSTPLVEGDPFTIGSEPLDLTFSLESAFASNEVYFEVHLHRIELGAAAALVTERVYIGLDPATPRITFDAASMRADKDYVFSIRTYRRYLFQPYDLTSGEYPQALSTIYTRTFRRQ